jgi:hypothetical protein
MSFFKQTAENAIYGNRETVRDPEVNPISDFNVVSELGCFIVNEGLLALLEDDTGFTLPE